MSSDTFVRTLLRWQTEGMLLGLFQRIFTHLEPSQARALFVFVQFGLVLAILAFIYSLTHKRDESRFKVREADKPRSPRGKLTKDTLGEARMKRTEPLRLSGIRIDGEPHEVLGVSRNASAAEIQRAYRDLMKRYHPDLVGRPGTREWADAQKIAEAINTARSRLLAQSQSPNRSGR